LEAHRAAHVLQEMLTIKSDDVRGRANAFEAMVKGDDIPAPSVPESFKVLMRELNSLGLTVNPIDSEEVEEDEGPVEPLSPDEIPDDPEEIPEESSEEEGESDEETPEGETPEEPTDLEEEATDEEGGES